MLIDANLRNKLINWRRDIHRHAEVAWTEFRTTSLIIDELESLGFSVLFGKDIHAPEHRLGVPSQSTLTQQRTRALEQGARPEHVEKMGDGFTGVVATLETSRPGPTMGFRFDIDANDLIESQSEDHRPAEQGFASVNHGAMHGCGHDAHTAIGLGVATLLSNNVNDLCGKIKLIFQPAEEGVRGAASIVAKDMLDDVDFFAAVHMAARVPLGAVDYAARGFLATTKFDVSYTGIPAHAANLPEEGQNALLAAATAALNLHAIPRHSDGRTRINVGTLYAGTGRNVIPAQAHLEAETRGETTEVNNEMFDRAKAVVEGAAVMHNVSHAVKVTGKSEVCDPSEELTPLVKKAFSDVDAVTELFTEDQGASGSEDATIMMRRVQNQGGLSTYIKLGSEKPFGHHTELFDINEDVLAIGAEGFFNLARMGQCLDTER